jgi:hypothetical protein
MSKHKIISLVTRGVRLVGYGLGMIAVYPYRHLTGKYDLLLLHAFVFLFFFEVLSGIKEGFESK